VESIPWFGWVIALAALLTAFTVIWRAVRTVLRWARRINDFFEDWNGQPARPGVPERPGVMPRLADFDKRLKSVEHELHPNSGASLRDAVDRIHEATVDPTG
jgi:hypothetical protein